jgi:Ca2+-binding EF-hand superfamily protein
MKKLALATFVAMGFAAAAAAQPPSQRSGVEPGVQTPSTQGSQPIPQGGDRTVQAPFDTIDANKDGKVNSEEGNRIPGFDFSRADTNGDGSLTRQEYSAAMATSTPREGAVESGDRTVRVTFDTADKNKDGKINREEANEIPGFNFSKADVDDSASVSPQEFQTAMANSTPRG